MEKSRVDGRVRTNEGDGVVGWVARREGREYRVADWSGMCQCCGFWQ